eukprot:16101_1
MADLRSKMMDRGTDTVFKLGKSFRLMDKSGDGHLGPAELSLGLSKMGISMDKQSLETLLVHIDHNKDGKVSFDEFLRKIKGDMDSGRVQLVKAAFHKLDADGSGVIDLSDVRSAFSTNRSDQEGEEGTLKKFLEVFESDHPDGKVTWDEFKDYYEGISCLVDNDEYFAHVVKKAWGL